MPDRTQRQKPEAVGQASLRKDALMAIRCGSDQRTANSRRVTIEWEWKKTIHKRAIGLRLLNPVLPISPACGVRYDSRGARKQTWVS